MFGILCTCLVIAAISVYVFHDVDRMMIGHWNEAFAASCDEGVLFTLIVGGGASILILLGRSVFHLKGFFPRAKVGFFVGVGVTMFKYPWEFAARVFLPKFADTFLAYYLVFAIIVCAAILLIDNFKQKTMSRSDRAPMFF